MKLASIFISICFLLISNYSVAQTDTVYINFSIDGKPLEYKNAVADFFSNNDTVRISIKNGRLDIPQNFIKKKATVVFYINQFALRFEEIPISINNLYPKWNIGIDKKPFDKKRLWAIKNPKKTKIHYYLKNNYGKLFTVDLRKESLILRKEDPLIAIADLP